MLEEIEQLPPAVMKVMSAAETGAYIRGLIKSAGLPAEKTAPVAFNVLRVALGRKTLEQLPSLISTEAGLPNDKAQKMAREIEEDLLGPVKEELTKFWAQQKNKPAREAGTRAEEAGARNVLNLKESPKPPTPPWRK